MNHISVALNYALDDIAGRAKLAETTARLTGDEPAVLAVLEECGVSVEDRTVNAERCVGGAAQYGALDIASDTRKFLDEAVEELVDARFYLAVEVVRLRRRIAEEPANYHRTTRIRARVLELLDEIHIVDRVARELRSRWTV